MATAQKYDRRIPNHDPRAISPHFEKLIADRSEKQLAATMLWDEETAKLAIARLTPEDFALADVRQFFACFAYAAGVFGEGQVDVRAIIPAMAQLGPWKSEGEARSWLLSLARGQMEWPMRAYTRFNISEIRTASRKRKALERIQIAAQTLANDDLSDSDVSEARDALTDALRASDQPIDVIADSALDFLDSIDEGSAIGKPIPTGLSDLDEMIAGGFRHGQLVVVAGRTGGGKTSFALQVATKQAENGNAVLVVSLEMPKPECIARMLSQMSGIASSSIINKELDDQQRRKVVEAQSRLAGIVLGIDDNAKRTIDEIEANAADFKRRNGLDVLVVDYIQIIKPHGKVEERHRAEVVGAFTRGLKVIARSLNCVVIALAQLKRNDDEKAKPKLSELRESGSIEQDADIVMFVHGCNTGRIEKHNASIIIAKQRSGPQSEVIVDWCGLNTSFSDCEKFPSF